jgi:leucyl-tRNA synthetase
MVRAVSAAELPVRLPEMEDFQPTGTPEPLLSKAPDDWLYATAPDGTRLKRETNSMPQWAGSCWYYLRFCDNKNSERFIDPVKEKYWLPVDLYIGGAEHAVLHLLYARFWHKVLFDRGHVTCPEPFARLVNQGMILGEMEYRISFQWEFKDIPASDLSQSKKDEAFSLISASGQNVDVDDVEKMPLEGERYVCGSVDTDGFEKRDGRLFLKRDPSIDLERRTEFDTEIVVAYALQKFTPLSVTDNPVGPLQFEGTGKIAGRKEAVRKLNPDQVEKRGDIWTLKHHPTVVVDARSYKMSKSRGNVINPDTVVAEYGADSLRLYEMFMGPLEATKPWSMAGVDGIYRFLGRVWRLVADDRADDVQLNAAVQDVPATPEQTRILHKTIKAVTDDIDRLQFNTAISRMMEFTNELTGHDVRPKSVLSPFVLLLSPFAPHLAEELWQLLGHENTLAYEPWPQYDAALLEDAEVEVAVQVNGKVRGKVLVPKAADQATVEAAARAVAAVAQNLEGKTVAKVFYVPGRLLSFSVK